MKIFKKGGIFVICLCLYYMKLDLFFEVIKDVVKDVKKILRFIEYRM